ncbi:hypothetical protein B9G54_05525 [Alloscardovia macacae]|nr:hypothetical protein B9G54_05525 [Alloscardovia macacae]
MRQKEKTVPDAQKHTRARVAHPYRVLSALYVAAFTGMYSETAMNIILPTIGEQFHVSTSLTQWLVVGYMLMIGLVLPFSSILLKHFSLKSLTLFALGCFAVGAAMSALAPNFALLLTGRAIQGIGLGLALPMMFSLVLEIMPPEKLGAAMGMTTLVIMVAPVIGPTLAGVLAGLLSWRDVFWSIALLAVVGMVLAVRFLISPYELTRPHVDMLSVVLSVLGFGGLVLGAGMASEYGWLSVPVLAALVVGVLCLVWYCTRQLRLAEPVLNLRAFGFRDFTLGVTLVMLNFGITLTVMFLLPQFFQNGVGLAVALVGVIMIPGGVLNAFTGAMSGRAYNRLGARVPGLAGFGVAVLGLVVLLSQTFVAEPNAVVVVLAHCIIMVGVPLAMSPLQTYALSTLPRELNPDGSAIMNTLQQVVGAVFTAVATSLLVAGQSAYGDAGSASARFSFGTRWGLFFSLAIALLGFVGAFFVRDTRKTMARPAAEAQDELSALMKTDVYTISEDATAMDAIRVLTSRGISGAPVVRADGSLAGFVSDGDILRLVADQVPEFTTFYSAIILHNTESFSDRVRENMSRPVSDFATTRVISVDVHDSMAHICEVLVTHHLKKVPVMDSGRMVGILNRSDVLGYVMEQY